VPLAGRDPVSNGMDLNRRYQPNDISFMQDGFGMILEGLQAFVFK
jgi:hypothetical protein